MTTYAGFLRGINVGGKNVIKMTDLKHTLQSLGLSKVQTYIQSGNVLFQSGEGEKKLRGKIETTIQTAFGFPVVVILRTLEDLKQIIAECPFPSEDVALAQASNEFQCLYVALLDRAPLSEELSQVNVYQSEADQYRTIGRDIFILVHHSIRDSKLAANLDKLTIPITLRNWKTISKLVDLAKS